MGVSSINFSLPAPSIPLRLFTVAEYRRMMEAGIFGADERLELLEGCIVSKTLRTPHHDAAIALISDTVRGHLPSGWHLRIQSGFWTQDSEPEPDLTVVRGSPRNYVDHHPLPHEVELVVEVAHTSLALDLSVKARIYAAARLPAYWVVNLIDSCVHVFSAPSGPAADPSFSESARHERSSEVPLVVDGQTVALVPVEDLLV